MTRTDADSVGVVVPTYKGRQHLSRCLGPFLESPLRPRILVVDSSSGDGTVEEAERLGAETLVVPRHEFNHGATRELARRQLATDIVVMVTQDAYAKDDETLRRLVSPLIARDAPVAGTFETFLRAFNYPPHSNIRALADAPTYGAGLFFCSNAFERGASMLST